MRYYMEGSQTTGGGVFDQVLGLILTVLIMIYLFYAMLRPERF